MATVTIAHALLRWTDDTGRRRIAHHGQVVDLPDALIARYEPLGVFADHTATTAVAAVVAADEIASSPVLPDPPRQTEPKAVWEDYAARLHDLTGGRLGATPEAAAALDKRALIATTYEHEETSHG